MHQLINPPTTTSNLLFWRSCSDSTGCINIWIVHFRSPNSSWSSCRWSHAMLYWIYAMLCFICYAVNAAVSSKLAALPYKVKVIKVNRFKNCVSWNYDCNGTELHSTRIKSNQIKSTHPRKSCLLYRITRTGVSSTLPYSVAWCSMRASL